MKSLLTFALLVLLASAARAQNYAAQVINYANLGNAPYGDPAATLGQPTTLINGGTYANPVTYHASLVYGAYNTDPNGKPVIAVTGDDGYITVKFDAPVIHDNRHWYGDDFIVFGNPFFSGSVLAGPATDMTQDFIAPGGPIYQNGEPALSVSADGTDGSFVPLTRTSVFYPTNPYAWAGVSAQNPSGWDDSRLQDFTKPVNPARVPADFGGHSVAYAVNTLYDGSAGGAAYSLAGIVDNSGVPLTSIQYIRFSGTGGSSVVDAVSRVSLNPALAAPEPKPLVVFALGALGIALRRIRFSLRKGTL